MSRKPPYRTDRGRGGRNIPPGCWRCFWQEAGNCFNDELGKVPTKQVPTWDGKDTYTRNVGWEITDDHWYKCRDNLELKAQDKEIEEAEGADKRLLLLLEEAA